MEQNPYTHRKSNRIGSGMFLILIGILLLAYKMGAPIPGWLFTWPVILIVIGLFIGIKSQFRNPGGYIMIVIGTIFLLDNSIPGVDLHNYIAPIILISIGFIFLLKPKNSCNHRRRARLNNPNPAGESYLPVDSIPTSETNSFSAAEGEYINVQAVFGGIKKNVTTKNFKGGEIMSFMGGSEINFMQADILEPVVVEVNNVFGGTKLIIPSNWDLKNEISAVFGGVEDKRNFNTSLPDSSKQIVLKGNCVFGGIEVANY
jgi:predicted membrane protein